MSFLPHDVTLRASPFPYTRSTANRGTRRSAGFPRSPPDDRPRAIQLAFAGFEYEPGNAERAGVLFELTQHRASDAAAAPFRPHIHAFDFCDARFIEANGAAAYGFTLPIRDEKDAAYRPELQGPGESDWRLPLG